MTFMRNPCRRNAFDAFPIDPAETSIRNIRRVRNQALSDWKDQKGRLVARDGTEWELTAAQLNGLEETIINPLSRLQAEQFVHREHAIAADPELIEAAVALASELRAAIESPRILEEVADDLVAELGKSLPAIAPAPLEDSTPWPDPPAALPVELESYAQTILRER